eukprot:scaffold208403_cov30-Tisochrysis_lutea.AAC.2
MGEAQDERQGDEVKGTKRDCNKMCQFGPIRVNPRAFIEIAKTQTMAPRVKVPHRQTNAMQSRGGCSAQRLAVPSSAFSSATVGGDQVGRGLASWTIHSTPAEVTRTPIVG